MSPTARAAMSQATGEICYHNVYETLKRLGYKYRVGYELFPEKDTKTAVTAIMQD